MSSGHIVHVQSASTNSSSSYRNIVVKYYGFMSVHKLQLFHLHITILPLFNIILYIVCVL